MYTGYLLSAVDRAKLLKQFKPSYPDVYAHHITEKFGVKKNTPTPKQPTSVNIVGYINNGESVEGFLVEIDGSTARPSGGYYHITWSIDKTLASPVDTNKYINTAKRFPPIAIDVESKLFY